MWTLLALVSLIFIGLFWGHDGQEPSTSGEGGNALSDNNRKVSTMTATTEAPFATDSCSTITFSLTRWDLFAAQGSTCLHNRVIQVVLLLGLIIVEWVVLDSARPDSPGLLLFTGLGVVIAFLCLVAVPLGLALFALAFLFKHRGVLGEHVLEITERGLVERTEFNEALAKWPAIRRIRTTRRYLYVYVSDFNFHAVPKRRFSKQQMAAFEADLRAHAVKIGQ